ncbi:MAG: EutN/CcmL family microcompartment protein [Planctomycetales bacterium]|nr:EutN/CcmL family microcompartment protein [Planctomycetales bacterium]
MVHAKVMGSATATIKHRTLVGCKLLLVQPLMADRRSPDGDPVLAADTTGAGRGDLVAITSDGRFAREITGDETTPLRWTVMGIED